MALFKASKEREPRGKCGEFGKGVIGLVDDF
jgi:hypothetical protein